MAYASRISSHQLHHSSSRVTSKPRERCAHLTPAYVRRDQLALPRNRFSVRTRERERENSTLFQRDYTSANSIELIGLLRVDDLVLALPTFFLTQRFDQTRIIALTSRGASLRAAAPINFLDNKRASSVSLSPSVSFAKGIFEKVSLAPREGELQMHNCLVTEGCLASKLSRKLRQ